MYDSIITGVVAIIVCMVNNYFQNRKTVSLIEYRLIQLEHKVGQHNNLDGRLHELDNKVQVQEEKIRVVNHRVRDLEKE